MAASSSRIWQAEGFRLSVFLDDAIDPTNMSFWEQLVGDPPDEVQRKPREQSFKEGGPLFSGRLSVEASKDRIDWRLNFDPNNASDQLPILGSYDSLKEQFRKLMREWFTHCPPTHRLGYGAVLLLPTETSSEACKLLDDLLPAINIDWENTYDFLYRINRRRPSRCNIQGLEINRLATWSVASVSGVRVNFAPSRPIPSIIQLSDSTLCRLELDINTAPEFRQKLDGNIGSDIFDELVNFGDEIASEGDIP